MTNKQYYKDAKDFLEEVEEELEQNYFVLEYGKTSIQKELVSKTKELKAKVIEELKILEDEDILKAKMEEKKNVDNKK